MRKMNPLELKAHALNYRLYGKEKPDPELVQSISKHGVLEPLTILKNGTIISGHRRWRAAMACQPMPKNIPCKIVGYPDDLAEQEAVIEYNRQRRKTFEQLMNECTQLEKIYKTQAKENQLAGLKQYREKVKSEFEKQERIYPEKAVRVEPVKDGLEILDKIKKAAPA
ncbi:MAG: ParB N-terminal domain-containing protein, partial [Methanobacterium paludis]|nr:ParB N-terminal domain-containing protein [Methanobacterium paludis]